MEYTQQNLAESYKKLPESLKNLIADLDTGEAVRTIGNKHQLHIDQMGLLADSIGAVIFGVMPSAQFMEDITTKLKIDRIIAENIAVEVNSQIFLKIRGQLKQLSENKDQLPTQADVLKEIENPPAAPMPIITPTPIAPPAVTPEVSVPVPPPAAPAPSVLEQKMSGAFSLPKENPTPTEFVDPYREALK